MLGKTKHHEYNTYDSNDWLCKFTCSIARQNSHYMLTVKLRAKVTTSIPVFENGYENPPLPPPRYEKDRFDGWMPRDSYPRSSRKEFWRAG